MTDASDFVDDALAVLGGEDTEFYVQAGEDTSYRPPRPVISLNCGYGECEWGYTINKIELWELAADARDHWENTHA